jgi:hypothetical protein
MRRLRPWAFLLVLYMGADFLDPAVPGIFFFDHDQLFLDGVVELKPIASPLAPHQPTPGSGGRAVEVARRPTPGRPVVLSSSPKPARWASARRVESSSPSPPSPDDH